MKKRTLLLFFIFAFAIILKNSAQDSIKASRNQFLTELNVNLFQGQLSLNNTLKQIKLRYMENDAMALRIGFTVNSNSQKHNSEQVYGTSPGKNNVKQNSTLIGINLGFEKHFAGTKRLSPYIGGELALGYKWSKQVTETNDLTTTIKGAWNEIQYVRDVNGNYYYLSSTSSERGFFSYGLNVVTGFDFYIAKHFYIGYEMQFGLTRTKYSDVDITYSGTGSSSYSPAPDLDESEFAFGPNLTNGVRIGYVF